MFLEQDKELNRKIQSYANAIDSFLKKKCKELVICHPKTAVDIRLTSLSILCLIIAKQGSELIYDCSPSLAEINHEDEQDFCEKIKEFIFEEIQFIKTL